MIKFKCKEDLQLFIDIFKFLTSVEYSNLRRNLENWLILKFVFIHFKAVKVSQNDQIQI